MALTWGLDDPRSPIVAAKSPSRQQPARLSQMSDSFRKALFTSGALLVSHSQRMFC